MPLMLLNSLQTYGTVSTTTNETGDGTAAAPAWTFSADPDNGIYRVAANAMGFALAGAVAGRWDTTGFRIGAGIADRKFDVLDTAGPQARLTYTDGSVYVDLQSDSGGHLRVTGSGGRMVVGSGTPLARLHAIEATAGDAVMRLTTVATGDDPMIAVFQARAVTTNATPTLLQTLDLSALIADGVVLVEARIVARRTGGAAGAAGDGAAYIRRAAFKVITNVETQIGATSTDDTFESQAGWDATLDVSGGNARVMVTGAVDNDITWHVSTLLQQVGS